MIPNSGTIRADRRTALFLSFFFSVPLLLGCGGESTDESSGETAREAAGDPVYGGVYRFNETDGIKTLDPVAMTDAPSHHIVHQMAELLVDFDGELNLTPELAESWSLSEDGKTYTYRIRRGVMFHDDECFPDGKGREMTAHDVKYSFDRILDARALSKGSDYFRDRVVGALEYYEATGRGGTVPEEGVAGFRVVDDYTFEIDLIEPFTPFQYYPTLGFCYVYPREAVEHYGQEFQRNLVATGPFRLKSWEDGREIYMERNPTYWGKDEAGNQLPYLEAVSVSFIGDQSTMLSEFRSGNLEENYRIPNDYIQAIFEPRQPGSDDPWVTIGEYRDFIVQRVVELSSQYYGMVTISEVFGDPRVRQAFNYAIDRERIVEFVMKGQAAGIASHGIVPPSMPDYPIEKVKGYTFDPEKARELLAEAGYPDGAGFPQIALQVNEGGGRNVTLAEAIKEELKKNLGVDVGLDIVQWSQHLERIDAGDAPFFRLGWIADYPEPDNFLNLLWGKNAAPEGEISPINSTRYNNPEFDRLYEQALTTQDRTERMNLYAQAEQIAVNDAPMLWIYYDMQFRLLQPWVKNYQSNAMNRVDLREVWIDREDV